MATLENAVGSSLVPDNSAAINSLVDAIGENRDRQDKFEIAEARQKMTNRLLPSLITGGRGMEEALIRLAAVNPDVATQMQSIVTGRNARQLQAERLAAEKGLRDASFILGGKNLAGMRTRVRQLADKAAVEGRPLDKFVGLMNKNEDELRTEMERMLSVGGAIQDIWKAASGAGAEGEGFTLAPGQKRFDAQGREIASVEEGAKAVEPTADVKNLLAAGINPNSAEGRELIKKAVGGKGGVTVNVGDTEPPFKVPSGFMLRDPNDPAQGVKPIPGGPTDNLTAENAAKTQMLRTAQEAFKGVKDLVFDKKGGLNRINIANAALNTPGTEGRMLKTMMEFGIQGITRAETGAAMPDKELDNTRIRFMPAVGDTVEVANIKLKMFEDFIGGTLRLIDPTGRFNESRFQNELTKRSSRGNKSKDSRPVLNWNPATGKLEPAKGQ